jgi:hypothetical protein
MSSRTLELIPRRSKGLDIPDYPPPSFSEAMSTPCASTLNLALYAPPNTQSRVQSPERAFSVTSSSPDESDNDSIEVVDTDQQTSLDEDYEEEGSPLRRMARRNQSRRRLGAAPISTVATISSADGAHLGDVLADLHAQRVEEYAMIRSQTPPSPVEASTPSGLSQRRGRTLSPLKALGSSLRHHSLREGGQASPSSVSTYSLSLSRLGTMSRSTLNVANPESPTGSSSRGGGFFPRKFSLRKGKEPNRQEETMSSWEVVDSPTDPDSPLPAYHIPDRKAPLPSSPLRPSDTPARGPSTTTPRTPPRRVTTSAPPTGVTTNSPGSTYLSTRSNLAESSTFYHAEPQPSPTRRHSGRPVPPRLTTASPSVLRWIEPDSHRGATSPESEGPSSPSSLNVPASSGSSSVSTWIYRPVNTPSSPSSTIDSTDGDETTPRATIMDPSTPETIQQPSPPESMTTALDEENPSPTRTNDSEDSEFLTPSTPSPPIHSEFPKQEETLSLNNNTDEKHSAHMYMPSQQQHYADDSPTDSQSGTQIDGQQALSVLALSPSLQGLHMAALSSSLSVASIKHYPGRPLPNTPLGPGASPVPPVLSMSPHLFAAASPYSQHAALGSNLSLNSLSSAGGGGGSPESFRTAMRLPLSSPSTVSLASNTSAAIAHTEDEKKKRSKNTGKKKAKLSSSSVSVPSPLAAVVSTATTATITMGAPDSSSINSNSGSRAHLSQVPNATTPRATTIATPALSTQASSTPTVSPRPIIPEGNLIDFGDDSSGTSGVATNHGLIPSNTPTIGSQLASLNMLQPTLRPAASFSSIATTSTTSAVSVGTSATGGAATTSAMPSTPVSASSTFSEYTDLDMMMSRLEDRNGRLDYDVRNHYPQFSSSYV